MYLKTQTEEESLVAIYESNNSPTTPVVGTIFAGRPFLWASEGKWTDINRHGHLERYLANIN